MVVRRQVVDPQARLSIVTKIREMGGAPAPLDLWRRLEDDGDPMADSVRAWIDRLAPAGLREAMAANDERYAHEASA